jgi:hypothetical protein
MSSEKKDNSTLRQKARLRNMARLFLPVTPVVMETHGGYGHIYLECYSDVRQGVVFETSDRKVLTLAEQRPSWAVYQADCVAAIAQGAGAHLPVNFLDVDPYGDPWPVISAFFSSNRPRPDVMMVCVNDGLRQKLKMNDGWSTSSLEGIVERYGNDAMFARYLDICAELLQEKAASAGYTLDGFTGYYCGFAKQMTHYAARLTRATSAGLP